MFYFYRADYTKYESVCFEIPTLCRILHFWTF